jgi:hypothetical protein
MAPMGLQRHLAEEIEVPRQALLLASGAHYWTV